MIKKFQNLAWDKQVVDLLAKNPFTPEEEKENEAVWERLQALVTKVEELMSDLSDCDVVITFKDATPVDEPLRIPVADYLADKDETNLATAVQELLELFVLGKITSNPDWTAVLGLPEPA